MKLSKNRRKAYVKRADQQKVAQALVYLDAHLPPLAAASDKQAQFGADVREKYIICIAEIVAQLANAGTPDDVLRRWVHQVIDSERAKDARHWIAHWDRIGKRQVNPIEYWREIMAKPVDETITPAVEKADDCELPMRAQTLCA